MGTKHVHMNRCWVLVCVLPLLLQGCLGDRKQHGTEIDPLLLGQLQPSLSTKAEVVRLLGVPRGTVVVEDREAWIYDDSIEEHWLLFLGLYNEQRKTMHQRGVAVLFA